MTQPHPSYVCVIDDDPDIREVIALALEEHGYRVVVAADGAEGLRELRRDPGCSLILLDLMMPGLNGWEFREIQQKDSALAKIPVLVLSGVRGLPEHAEQLDATAYLQKPVELERLISAIGHHARPPL
jgi:CheY-like chemotaxis protein